MRAIRYIAAAVFLTVSVGRLAPRMHEERVDYGEVLGTIGEYKTVSDGRDALAFVIGFSSLYALYYIVCGDLIDKHYARKSNQKTVPSREKPEERFGRSDERLSSLVHR